MPFWRGDFPWRPYELGERVGAFRRAVAERLHAVRAALAHYLAARGVLPPDHPDLIEPTPTRGPGLASQRKESA